ncbi:MAG: phage major capsid protein [Hyphomicrobiaceae bacterium]|nr:phage major capsid protein [Hyphomicrobiaceae bacterium]
MHTPQTHASPPTPTLETKSADPAVLDDLNRAFAEFKSVNDQRLADLETKLTSDVVTTDKLVRIERALDELSLKAARPAIGGGAPTSQTALAHKSAFHGYVRKGSDTALRSIEQKALSVASDPDGGFLVPAETEAEINRALRAISPIRAIAGVRQVSGTVYKRPYVTTGIQTGWAAETAARPQTNTQTLASLSFPTMELYAMPAATTSLLDDGVVDIDAWLAEEVRIAFAEQEGAAFVTGDGVNKPKGFLSYPTVANATWTWGNIGTVSTGVAGGFAATNPADKLIDLAYSVKAPYRANGTFVMNRSTQSAVRKLKDGDGTYLWQPATTAAQLPTLLGYPVAESEDMPDIAANSLSVAFGDFQRGYLIVDRVGIRVLRDPYSAKPYVLFYTTKRVGGGVSDFDAIKLLKFAV